MKNKTEIRGFLSRLFKEKTVVVGVGNPMRGDDAFGPAFIERINGAVGALCIDAGSAPENYLGKIVKLDPDSVLIVDAAHLGGAPGEYDILEKDQIASSGFTTHDLSPVMFIEYLEKETKARIYMLAVQPEKMDLGAEMSESVKEALDELADIVKEAKDA